MEYYGNLNNKRLALVSAYDVDKIMDKATEIGFINKKGMLLDYTIVQFENHQFRWIHDGIAETTTMKNMVMQGSGTIIWTDDWKNMRKIKRNKINYYIGESKIYANSDAKYGVFMELPRIENDKNFTWKENRKYDTKECVIDGDTFKFEIIAKPNGNALINVRYTKCENKHRNNVTVAQIDVYNASNQDILDAISKWKNTMIQDLRNIA